MNKKTVIGIVIAIIAILGIVMFVNQDNSNGGNEKQYTNISSDEFTGTIIANDNYQITVVPNEDELIRQSSFDIINVVISENTKIYLGESQVTIDDVNVNDVIKVTFDGKIYEVKPGKIIAQEIIIINQHTDEENEQTEE